MLPDGPHYPGSMLHDGPHIPSIQCLIISSILNLKHTKVAPSREDRCGMYIRECMYDIYAGHACIVYMSVCFCTNEMHECIFVHMHICIEIILKYVWIKTLLINLLLP